MPFVLANRIGAVLVEKKKNRSIDISQSAEKPKVSTTPQEVVKGKTLTKEEAEKNYDKIIRNIAKEVTIDKSL